MDCGNFAAYNVARSGKVVSICKKSASPFSTLRFHILFPYFNLLHCRTPIKIRHFTDRGDRECWLVRHWGWWHADAASEPHLCMVDDCDFYKLFHELWKDKFYYLNVKSCIMFVKNDWNIVFYHFIGKNIMLTANLNYLKNKNLYSAAKYKLLHQLSPSLQRHIP